MNPQEMSSEEFISWVSRRLKEESRSIAWLSRTVGKAEGHMYRIMKEDRTLTEETRDKIITILDKETINAG